MINVVVPRVYFPGDVARGMRVIAEQSRKESLDAALKWWHTRALPRHFTAAGARLYGYSPRGKNYSKRKAQKYGHQLPLVLSGDLMHSMTGNMPVPQVTANSGKLRYGNLPHYTTIYQKVSQEQISEALGKYNGNLKASATALGVSLRTIQRRIKNGKDVHESSRISAWRERASAINNFMAQWKSVDAVGAWRAMHTACNAALKEFNGNFLAAAKSMNMGQSAFGRYLRNAEYHGRQTGQTADKVKELLTTTDDEVIVMARIARDIYVKNMAQALKGK